MRRNHPSSATYVQRLPCCREHNTLHSGVTCQSLRRRRAFGELNEDVQELSECRLAVCIPQPDRQNHIYLRATDPAVPTSALQLGESTEGISCTQRRLGFACREHRRLQQFKLLRCVKSISRAQHNDRQWRHLQVPQRLADSE